MYDPTLSHGIVEEPSSEAQELEIGVADTTVTYIPEDDIAKCETAEQGMVEEPSAKAQKEMLKEAQA